ncbi:antitoxin [Streptomyces sp. NPDC092129]|uniref:antitoxin n=1 Tax=Streptomyces sp. NPDC092129 TaxID=3366010 RepID=UPI0037FCBF04
MSVLIIQDVPEDQIRILKARAAQAGKSLLAYMQDLIAAEAAKPTVRDMAARLEREAAAQYATDDVLAAIEEGRLGY